MNDKIFVLTHKNPDTDSVCSALALSELYGYTAVAVGELNSQTEYVLRRQPAPGLIFSESLQREARDIMKPAIFVKENSLLKDAIEIMNKKKIRSIPVVDESNALTGMLTSRVLSESALKGMYLENIRSRIFFSDISKALNGRMLFQPKNDNISGKFMIAAMMSTDFSKKIQKDDVLITGLRKDIIDISLKRGITKFIITGRRGIPEDIKNKFKAANAGVILARTDTFYTAHLIQFALRVKEIMLKNVEMIRETTLENEIGNTLKNVPYGLPVTDKQRKVMGMISHAGFISVPRRKVVLVDHNEFSQAIEGIRNADILAVYDHHRLGDIQTTQPIFVRNEPLGSTCTIIYKMYREQGKTLTKKVGYWLICGILSDTLSLNSPTTTKTDIDAVEYLSRAFNIDYSKIGKKLIEVKFGLKAQNILDIIAQDYKEYQIKDKKIGISQIELVKASNYKNILKKIISNLGVFRQSRGIDVIMLMVTDMAENGSYLYYSFGEEINLRTIFERKIKQGLFVDFLFSRKKQLFPELVNALDS